MEQKTKWNQGLVDSYLTRTLDENFPELKPYLQPGLTVLSARYPTKPNTTPQSSSDKNSISPLSSYVRLL
jgi:hypothetical protein